MEIKRTNFKDDVLDKLDDHGFAKTSSVRVLVAKMETDLEKRKTNQDKTDYVKTNLPMLTV